MRGKFGRNYRLDIFTPSGRHITIAPPFSIQFNLQRAVLSSSNRGDVILYNLSPATRNQIYKDRYSLVTEWPIILHAGYGNRLHTIFKGKIFEAYSYKQGTEWLTKITFFDGMDAIQNGYSSITVEKDTPKGNLLDMIINDMAGVIKGTIGSIANGGEAPRGKSLIGQSSELLTIETDDNWFIDLERVNVLTNEEVIGGDVIRLDRDNLLGTPRRRETYLEIPVLFEAQINVGHIYEIESLEAKYNGQYKVLGFNHNVTISSAVAGQAITNVTLDFGADGLQEVSP